MSGRTLWEYRILNAPNLEPLAPLLSVLLTAIWGSGLYTVSGLGLDLFIGCIGFEESPHLKPPDKRT